MAGGVLGPSAVGRRPPYPGGTPNKKIVGKQGVLPHPARVLPHPARVATHPARVLPHPARVLPHPPRVVPPPPGVLPVITRYLPVTPADRKSNGVDSPQGLNGRIGLRFSSLGRCIRPIYRVGLE